MDRILRSIVEATVAMFDAEAASIALVEDDGRLRFRVAAGARGAGVVGLTVESGEGVAGYVAATGQPLALSDVAADPRFGRSAARATGYLPRSLLAVPLELDDRVIGVLEVLDRRGDRPFDLTDVSRAGMFARQAAVAIDVARIETGVARILVDALRRIAADASPDAIEALVAAGTARLDRGSPAYWALVDRVAAARAADPASLDLVVALLDAVIAHTRRRAHEAGPATPRAGAPSWRARAGLADDEPE